MPDSGYESRKRWNAENYRQVNIAVRPELAEAFRRACESNAAPMREVLAGYMSEYAQLPPSADGRQAADYSSRGRRRKAVASITAQLMAIRDAEGRYLENMPDNLRGSSRSEAAEQAVVALEEAIGLLGDAFD